MRASCWVAGAMGIAGVVAFAAPAGAINPHEPGENWVCGGVATVINTAGRNGYINGVKYQAIEFTINATNPTTGETFNVTKTWAKGKDSAGAFQCTMPVSEDGFVGTATVTAVPQ